jgi:hypothetical protein
VAGVLADLVFDLLLDAHGWVGVAEFDADDRVPGVLQAGGVDAGEQGLAGAGVAEDEQRGLGAVRGLQVAGDRGA